MTGFRSFCRCPRGVDRSSLESFRLRVYNTKFKDTGFTSGKPFDNDTKNQNETTKQKTKIVPTQVLVTEFATVKTHDKESLLLFRKNELL